MPVTPKFTICQSETDLTITIRAPYARIETAEAFVDESSFLFSAHPYFLRLHFNEKLILNDDPTCKYISDDNSYKFNVIKANKGQTFSGLDGISSLLSAPESQIDVDKTGISVVGEEDTLLHDSSDEEIDPLLQPQDSTCVYGNIKPLFFNEVHTLFQLKSLDSGRQERLQLAQDVESFDFNPEHYLADLEGTDDKELQTYTGLPSVPAILEAEVPKSLVLDEYTTAEFDSLQALPRRRPLLTTYQKKLCTNQFLEILWGVCYVRRTTQFNKNLLEKDPACYTLRRLSRSLSWLVTDTDLQSTCRTISRRSLIYPVRRNLQLTAQIYTDLLQLLKSNSIVPTIRALLDAVDWCNYAEAKVLSDCFIVPVLQWIQTREASWLHSLAAKISKKSRDLELEDLELDLSDYVGMEDDSDSEEIDVDAMMEQIERYKAFLLEEQTKADGTKATKLIEELNELSLTK